MLHGGFPTPCSSVSMLQLSGSPAVRKKMGGELYEAEVEALQIQSLSTHVLVSVMALAASCH